MYDTRLPPSRNIMRVLKPIDVGFDWHPDGQSADACVMRVWVAEFYSIIVY